MSLPCNWTWWMLALFSREHALSFQPHLTYLGRPVIFRTQFSTCLSVCLVKSWGLNCQLCSHEKIGGVFFFPPLQVLLQVSHTVTNLYDSSKSALPKLDSEAVKDSQKMIVYIKHFSGWRMFHCQCFPPWHWIRVGKCFAIQFCKSWVTF